MSEEDDLSAFILQHVMTVRCLRRTIIVASCFIVATLLYMVHVTYFAAPAGNKWDNFPPARDMGGVAEHHRHVPTGEGLPSKGKHGHSSYSYGDYYDDYYGGGGGGGRGRDSHGDDEKEDEVIDEKREAKFSEDDDGLEEILNGVPEEAVAVEAMIATPGPLAPTKAEIRVLTKRKPVDGKERAAAEGTSMGRTRIALVVCGNRSSEALTSIKSAVIAANRPLHAYVFVDEPIRKEFTDQLTSLQSLVTSEAFSFDILPVQFPSGQEKKWRTLFKLCACQRLFIPDILANVDSVIYVDTDTLFLSPPEDLWAHFRDFNESQMVGLVPETEDDSTNWYVRFARHPFYPPRGLNSGVMMMNLTRMRDFEWSTRLLPIYEEYKTVLTWGDQDVINIIFHNASEKVYVLGCDWNFRPDHCMYMSVCRSAHADGAHIIHGNRGSFYNNKQPPFVVLHKNIKMHTIPPVSSGNSNVTTLYGRSQLVAKVQKELETLTVSPSAKKKESKTPNCNKVVQIFYKRYKKLLLIDAAGA